MKVTLLLSTPEKQIGENAKICYATKQGGKDITSSLVHGHGHLAALRFAYATVKVEGISVACQNQIVRSKHLDFMVQSKRYVDVDKGGFSFVMPKNLSKDAEDKMREHWEYSLRLYKELLANGVKKEDARAILPANTSTEMVITGNLQAWWSFFTLRLNRHAQEEIREVARKVYFLLSQQFPQVFTEELLKKFEEAK